MLNGIVTVVHIGFNNVPVLADYSKAFVTVCYANEARYTILSLLFSYLRTIDSNLDQILKIFSEHNLAQERITR